MRAERFSKTKDGIGSYKLANGDTRYRVVYRVGEKIRTKGGLATKGAAQAWQRHTLVALDKGEWIDPSVGRRTFKDWAEEWLQTPGKRPTTAARDRNVLETVWIR